MHAQRQLSQIEATAEEELSRAVTAALAAAELAAEQASATASEHRIRLASVFLYHLRELVNYTMPLPPLCLSQGAHRVPIGVAEWSRRVHHACDDCDHS